jgi:hypothetical protein
VWWLPEVKTRAARRWRQSTHVSDSFGERRLGRENCGLRALRTVSSPPVMSTTRLIAEIRSFDLPSPNLTLATVAEQSAMWRQFAAAKLRLLANPIGANLGNEALG